MSIGSLEIYGIIYSIKNNINGKYYIGQTTQSFERRYCVKGQGVERVFGRLNILKDNGWNYNKHLFNAIDKYGVDNFSLNKNLDYAFSKEELNIKEQIWIKYYDSYKNGYNNNIGGDGNSGYQGLKGIDNPASREVCQFSLDGDFIKKWDYISEAEQELSILRSDICGACSGSKKSAGGFMWLYADEYKGGSISSYNMDYRCKPVIQLHIDGTIANKYNSILEASDILKCDYKCIIESCTKRKRYNGYLWIREEDYNESDNYIYEIPKKRASKPIIMYDLNMNFLMEFKSLNEAYKSTGFYRYEINKNINGENNKIKNFIFKHKYDIPIAN